MTYISGFKFALPLKFLKEIISTSSERNCSQSWNGVIESKPCYIETAIKFGDCRNKSDIVTAEEVNQADDFSVTISFMHTSIFMSKDHCLELNLSHVETNSQCTKETIQADRDVGQTKVGQRLREEIFIGGTTNIQTNVTQNDKSEVHDGSCAAPRKRRGRPRKTQVQVNTTTTMKESSVIECKQEDKPPFNTFQQDIVIEPLQEVVGAKRYSLRGVKLSESIMNAEKGIKFISDQDSEAVKDALKKEPKNVLIVKPDSSEMEVNLETTTSIMNNSESEDITGSMDESNVANYSNVETDAKENLATDENSEVIDYNELQAEEDQDYEPPSDHVYESNHELEDNDEEEYKPYRYKKKSKHLLKERAKNMMKRKRQKLDLGDVPQFERRKRNTEKIKACKYCSKLFCDYTGVEEHVKKFHMDEGDVNDYLEQLQPLKVVSCKLCDQKFQSRIILQDHENRVHYRAASVKCHKCGKIYKNIQSLRNHIRAIHYTKGQSHLCHLCPAKFKWQITLQQHIDEIHLGKADVQCKICGKSFARNNQLNRHMRSHGVDKSKRLICQQCGKGFWFDYNLRRHMEVIHGPHVERYHCSYCGKGFNLKGGMVTHVQQTHFNIFPFQCPVESCKVGFCRQKLLIDHMQNTHPEEKYEPTESQRGRYKYGRSTEDLFYCSHCSVSFCYKAKLVEHMHMAHSESFPHKCDKCLQGFLEKSFLLYHLKKAHNVEIDEEEILIAKANKIQEDNDKKYKIVTLNMDGNQVQICHVEEPPDENAGNLEDINQDQALVSREDNSLPQLEHEQSSSYTLDLNTSEANTIHYVIEDGTPAVLPEELANLLLAAGQTIDIGQSGEIELTTKTINDDGTETVTFISQGIDEFTEENIVETVEETEDIISESLC